MDDAQFIKDQVEQNRKDADDYFNQLFNTPARKVKFKDPKTYDNIKHMCRIFYFAGMAFMNASENNFVNKLIKYKKGR